MFSARNINRFLALSLTAACLANPVAAPAQEHDHAHPGRAPGAEAVTDLYAPAMEKMHKDMMVTPTGDADVDFVRGMIPHHQGAIDMAKILLQHTQDPELRALGEGIITAQEKEIAFMQEWLQKHAK